jgi:hypothetical protein
MTTIKRPLCLAMANKENTGGRHGSRLRNKEGLNGSFKS